MGGGQINLHTEPLCFDKPTHWNVGVAWRLCLEIGDHWGLLPDGLLRVGRTHKCIHPDGGKGQNCMFCLETRVYSVCGTLVVE